MPRSGAEQEDTVDSLDDLHQLCWAFKQAVGAIEVWNDEGQGMGTGFHIGQGYVITAAHVLAGASRATLSFHDFIDRALPETPIEEFDRFQDYLDVRRSPEEIDLPQVIYHDRGADIALFRSPVFAANDIEKFKAGRMPTPEHAYDRIHLGPPLEDQTDDDLLMLQGVVLGYPPIPFSAKPVLVAHEFRISAVIDRYDTGSPAFILSGMPRGGFSGAPVIAQGGWFLGVVTEALSSQTLADPLAFPYFQTIAPDPVLEILFQAGIRPEHVNPEFAALYQEFNVRSRSREEREAFWKELREQRDI